MLNLNQKAKKFKHYKILKTKTQNYSKNYSKLRLKEMI
jgi:hypothetical protein